MFLFLFHLDDLNGNIPNILLSDNENKKKVWISVDGPTYSFLSTTYCTTYNLHTYTFYPESTMGATIFFKPQTSIYNF